MRTTLKGRAPGSPPRASSPPRVRTVAAIVFAIVAAGLAGACAETRYTSFGDMPPPSDDLAALTRVVAFERDPRLLAERPRCVLVQPVPGQAVDPHLAAAIEEALLRYLSRRTARTVAGSHRDRLAREHALAADRPADAVRLARAANCDAVLTVQVVEPEAFYALVVASYRLGLELQLTRVADGAILWRARHIARRSEGGLPLGLSALTSAWSASAFVHDGESVLSLMDDLGRRLFATWPVGKTQKGDRTSR